MGKERKKRRMREGAFRADDGTMIYEMSMARQITKDGKVFKRVNRVKPPTRAQRCDAAISDLEGTLGDLESTANEIESVKEEIEELDLYIQEKENMPMEEGGDDEDMKKEEKEKREELEQKKKELENLVQQANDIIGNIDYSEVESLQDEMRSWADNMPDSLQGSDKYYTIDECANNLEEAMAYLQSISEITEEDDVQDPINDLQSAIDSLGNCEFPGMFG